MSTTTQHQASSSSSSSVGDRAHKVPKGAQVRIHPKGHLRPLHQGGSGEEGFKSDCKVETLASHVNDERWQKVLELVGRNRKELHIEYQGFLSNHMSHYLVALYKLGASTERLEEAFRQYRDGLEERHPPEGIKIIPEGQEAEETGGQSWRELRGKRRNYADLVEFFHKQIKAEGHRPILNRYLPHLITGLGGAAFHGLIQLGYSLEIHDEANMAEGLAYMTHCWYNVGEVSEDISGLSRKGPFELLKDLHDDPVFDGVLDGVIRSKDYGKFQTRIHHLVEAQGGRLLDQIAKYDIYLPVPEEGGEAAKQTIDEYVKTFSLGVIKIFGSTGCRGFFLLHLVTGMRALKKVIFELETPELQVRALRQFWRAAMCAYVALDRPAATAIDRLPEDEAKQVEGQTWNEIIEKTLPSPDEHLVKLVFVCRTEADEYPEAAELFRQVAAYTNIRYNAEDWDFHS